jgi:hypothetical protein
VNASIAKAPDFKLTYVAKANVPLTFYVQSTKDTTLLINLPNGKWIANDDGGAGLNPLIKLNNPISGAPAENRTSLGWPVAIRAARPCRGRRARRGRISRVVARGRQRGRAAPGCHERVRRCPAGHPMCRAAILLTAREMTMRRSGLMYALILSVLLNLGVVGAAGYQAMGRGGAATGDLSDHLKLDGDQRRRWHSLEESFLRELDAGWRNIAQHREALIREVFSESPDPARIEVERARIAELQALQQQRVIAQFLRERDILTAGQRRALVDLLLREEQAAPRERQLHGG